jgi:hypothetical protein
VNKLELKDWLNSINTTKEDLLEEYPENISSYQPFIINKCMSAHIDTVLFANEMNKYPFLKKDMQYAYYLQSIRKRKRYSPWIRKSDMENFDAVKEYYNYSDKKTLEALSILNREEIDFIKQRLNKGGFKK